MVELVRKWCFCKHVSENRLTNKHSKLPPFSLPAQYVGQQLAVVTLVDNNCSLSDMPKWQKLVSAAYHYVQSISRLFLLALILHHL